MGFVLLPNFTLMPFAAIIDALRLAADEGDRSRPIDCAWTIMAAERKPIRSSAGVEVLPWETFRDPRAFDYVAVIGGLLRGGPQADEATLAYLRRAAEVGTPLVAVCTGMFALLAAGLMRGRRCCVSWFHVQDLIEEFPDVRPVADRLIVEDGPFVTCAGGAGALDLGAFLVERHLGRARAQKSLHILMVDRARAPGAPQPQTALDAEVGDPRVRRALSIIEQNLSEPLDLADLAARVGLSPRQLGRLFLAEVGASVQEHARRQRLAHGAALLAQGDRPVAEIAQDCGFTDAAHFTRAFRARYGMTPAKARDRRQEA
jgi:transcriptional regulator GlxA family with amidase domain